jgi:uncharacterized membrane protein
VITFDDEQQAGQVRESIRKLQDSGSMSLDDSAVIVKDQNGKIFHTSLPTESAESLRQALK